MNPIDIDPNQLEGFTPERIARELFTKDPMQECSCQIVAEQEKTDIIYIFEILSIILLEGLEIIVGDLSKANLDNLNKELVMDLNPWFKSLGFKLNVQTFDFKDKDLYSKYYCKIIIRDILHEVIFEYKNIPKNYYFFINGDNLEENKKKVNLKELFGVFIIKDNVFKVLFDFHYPELPKNKIL